MDDSNGEFEIVEKSAAIPISAGKKSAPTSVLTSIPPPSELPSFIAAPVPMSTSSSSPHPSTQVSKEVQSSIISSPPMQSVPPPSQTMAPPPSNMVPPFLPSIPPSQDTSPQMIPMGIPPPSSGIPPPPVPFTSPVTNQPASYESKNLDPSSISMDPMASGGQFGSPHFPTDGNGWLGWIKGTVQSVSHRVAEKAKTSMDTMITTLDPQMKDFINSGGDIDIIIASDKEVKISPVREAFQKTFGKATVNGIASPCSGVEAQPIGFETALKSAKLRISTLRSMGSIHPQQPVIAVEGFIAELLPNEWFELGLLLLDDPWHEVVLQMYTQGTPVPIGLIEALRLATPNDYPPSGFSKTVGEAAAESLNVPHTMWQEALTGVPRRETIYLAARSLAGLYKSRLPDVL